MAEGQKQLGRINSADRERERTECACPCLRPPSSGTSSPASRTARGTSAPGRTSARRKSSTGSSGGCAFSIWRTSPPRTTSSPARWTWRLPEASASAARDPRDGLPTPEEWRRLQAEWRHDYGLRRMENRGVKYQDETERRLDHAAARGNAQADATAIPAGRATEPRHPWPSEVAEQVRHQPGPDHGHDNGHDNGHSM